MHCAFSLCSCVAFESIWQKGTGMTVRWKMQTEDGSLFEETIQWDHLFARSQTNSTKSFVRRCAEIESVTSYFHGFSTSGWAARTAPSFFGSESLKISGFPLWDVIVNDCAASSTALFADLGRTSLSIVQLQRRVELLLVCALHGFLSRSPGSLLVQLSWPHTTNTHFVKQQFCSHLHVCVHSACLL